MHIRPAEVKDKAFATEMIYETMGAMADQMFGLGSHELALEKISWFYCHPGNQFSHTNAEILEVDGQPAGLLLAMTGLDLNRSIKPMFWQTVKIYGLKNIFGVLWRSLPLAFEKEAESDEYYISNLAVHSAFRRRGLGEKLLCRAEEKARKLGIVKCSLTVEIGNTKARALYLKMGYEVVGVSTNALMRKLLATPGWERMVKILSPK